MQACGVEAGTRRLARAAGRNIDCGRVRAKCLPGWPRVPAFAWASWHGGVHSLPDPDGAGVIF